MTSADAPSDGWRRLHPLTILKELASLAWALVAAYVIGWDWDFDVGPFADQIESTETVVAVIIFGYAVVRYMFTSYRVTDDTVELRRGVVVRSLQTMPRDRVQSVGSVTSLLARVVGVTTVEISAADTEDIKLSLVSDTESEYLRQILDPARRPGIDGSTGEGESGEEELPTRQRLASLPPGRILLFALTEPGISAALLILGVTVSMVAVFGWFVAPVAALGVATFPIIRTIALIDFQSWLEGDRVKVESGLLSRRQTTSPCRRIQVIQVSRPLIRRLLGFETVTMVTGDVSTDEENLLASGFLAPLEPIGSWSRLVPDLIGPVAVEVDGLEKSSPLTVRRVVVRALFAILPFVVGGGIALGFLSPVWTAGPVLAGIVAVVLAVVYARERWRRLGWGLNDSHLMVRRGVLTERISVVPLEKLQDVTVRQTFFQRRLRLADVVVDTAGVNLAGNVTAVDLAEADARRLADRLAGAAASRSLPDGV